MMSKKMSKLRPQIILREMKRVDNNLQSKSRAKRLQKRLSGSEFTIVASNCIGAKMYQELGFAYNTPFVGLFIFAPCYVKLLSDLDSFLQSSITFTEKSRYESANNNRRDSGNYYPIGLLNGEVELHFIHYKSQTEAEAKWKRRVQRMKMDNLFFIFTDRDLCSVAHMEQFDAMPFKNKICFTASEHPAISSSLHITECEGKPYVDDLYTNFALISRHFDFVDWLNGEDGRHALR